jgi:hypothetical protein
MKIIIPTKEEVRRMELAGAYHHFNERLSQRYGIDITIDEYIILGKTQMQAVHKEKHKIIGVMKIKGVDVLVVRERYRKRKLITALPFKNIDNKKGGYQ